MSFSVSERKTSTSVLWEEWGQMDGQTRPSVLRLSDASIFTAKTAETPEPNNDSLTGDDSNGKAAMTRMAIITGHQISGQYLTKHITFVILAADNTTVLRRYTDFEWLHNSLTAANPGAFIPPIPPKLALKAMWPVGYLERRAGELQIFLDRIESMSYLRGDKCVKFFLRFHDNQFDEAKKRWDADRVISSHRHIYAHLCNTFPKVADEDYPINMEMRCDQSRRVVDRILSQMERMDTICENIVVRSEEVESSLMEMIQSLSALREIETEGVKENHKYCANDRIPIGTNLKIWSQYRANQTENFRSVDIILKRCMCDMKAMQIAIRTRDKLREEYNESVAESQSYENRGRNNTLSSTSEHSIVKFDTHRKLGHYIFVKSREEDLELLTRMVSKLSLYQLKIVWRTNLKRWQRCVHRLADSQILHLSKFVESWRDLEQMVTDSNIFFNISSPRSIHNESTTSNHSMDGSVKDVPLLSMSSIVMESEEKKQEESEGTYVNIPASMRTKYSVEEFLSGDIPTRDRH